MTTFNYSKLATLVPKQLQEEISAKEARQDGGYPPQDQLATSSYPPTTSSEVVSHQSDKAASHQSELVASRRRGDRHSKEKQLLGVRLSQAIIKQIKDFCMERGLSIQDFVELSASHYMEHVASHHVASQLTTVVANKLAHDDLMIFKTHDDIIMLFRQMTGRKWTAADDRAASPFNNIDRRLIEIGMIHTVFNARGKRINSFAYFIPEIQLMIDLHVNNENLDVYLRARRERLAKWIQSQGKNWKESKL